MPFYNFRNKETNEISEHFMSISKLDTFKQENPLLEVVIGTAALVESHKLDIRKTDGGFKETLRMIHHRTAGSMLNQTTNI